MHFLNLERFLGSEVRSTHYVIDPKPQKPAQQWGTDH